MGTLSWLHPAWFVALVVPLALLLVTQLPARPIDVPIATIRLWQRLAARAEGERRRRRPPLELLCVALALTAAILALARPVQSRGATRERWLVIVDRSPSLALPHGAGTQTRLDVALAALLAWAEGRVRACELELEWRAADWPAPRVTAGSAMPDDLVAALHRAPAAPYAAPEWASHDRVGVLWLTDDAPPAERAGVFASGGAAVPGPVGEDEGRYLVWDGADALTPGDRVPTGAVVLTGVAPEVVDAFVAHYAAERGLAFERAPRGERAPAASLRLEVRGPARTAGDPAPAASVGLGRSGWRARTTPGEDVSAPELDPWLVDDVGAVRVRVGRGRVAHDLGALALEPGVDAAFAASWAELFDGALLPSPGCVPWLERAAAGAPRVSAPKDAPPPVTDVERRERAPLLGALAACAALGALVCALSKRG